MVLFCRLEKIHRGRYFPTLENVPIKTKQNLKVNLGVLLPLVNGCK